MTAVPAAPWYQTVTREQWKTLLAATLGWTLDAMDFALYLMAINTLRAPDQLGFSTDMAGLLDSIAGRIQSHALVVSLAAGVTTKYLESRLPEGTSVVRVMPNTPALVDEGMAALSPGAHCSEEQLAHAEDLMRASGLQWPGAKSQACRGA